jgi:hypothetical protein
VPAVGLFIAPVHGCPVDGFVLLLMPLPVVPVIPGLVGRPGVVIVPGPVMVPGAGDSDVPPPDGAVVPAPAPPLAAPPLVCPNAALALPAMRTAASMASVCRVRDMT